MDSLSLMVERKPSDMGLEVSDAGYFFADMIFSGPTVFPMYVPLPAVTRWVGGHFPYKS